MKSVFLFLILTFSTLNANAQLGDLFRKLGDIIDANTKQNKVEEANKSEDTSEVFIKKEGQTIAQINSEAWDYCAWKGRKKDRKYITLEEVHPDFENIQIFKVAILDDENLTDDDLSLIKKRKCDERIYFLDGKNISLSRLKDMETEFEKNIPKELRDEQISQRNAKKQSELLEINNRKKEKELLNSANFSRTLDAIQKHQVGNEPIWDLVFLNEYNSFIDNAINICKNVGLSREDLDKLMGNLNAFRSNEDSCKEKHRSSYVNNGYSLRRGGEGNSGDFCFPNTYHVEHLETAIKRHSGYSNSCNLVISNIRKNYKSLFFDNSKLISTLKLHNDEYIKVILVNESILIKQKEDRKQIEENKRETAKRIAQENEQKLREQCLSSGSIGICQSSSQNNSQYICNQNPVAAIENLFNQYCYVTDQYNISTKMEVRNNTGKIIKDVLFNCSQNAKSGTILISNNKTIFDVWNPNEAKLIVIQFPKHEQVQSMNCKVLSWK